MKLLRVVTENVRNLPDGEHRFVDPKGAQPRSLVLVTGRMASGKTSLLEAIAMAKERVAGYGPPPDARRFLRRGETHGRVVLTLRLDEDERRRAGDDPNVEITVPLGGPRPEITPRLANFLSSYTHRSVSKMEYFPAHRGLDGALGPEEEPDERTEAYLRLRSDHDKYRGVVPWLRARLRQDANKLVTDLDKGGFATASDQPDSLAAFRRGMKALCPGLRLLGLGPDGDVWLERDDGGRLTIAELSDSEKDAVLFAATFQRIGLAHSIVLIDRPELYAHPNDHARWLAALCELGDNNQLIVATTSTALVTSQANVLTLDR